MVTSLKVPFVESEALRQRQWEIERLFHSEILALPPRSEVRRQAFRNAYTSVNAIHQELGGLGSDRGRALMDRVYRHTASLLINLLRAQRAPAPTLFEIGFGFGETLEAVARAGFRVAGIEIDPNRCDDLAARLDGELFLGDLLSLSVPAEHYNVVYWSDVFEHLPPDEALDYLRCIYRILVPGGVLVTITPNWHGRPGDVTRLFRSGRCEPEGFHLKEYTLREMIACYRQTGFRYVTMPIARTPGRRVLLAGAGLIRFKRAVEPLLELVPPRLARALCGVLGLSHTLAWK